MHSVRVYAAKEKLSRTEEFAYKIAAMAVDRVAIDKDVEEMVINRIIDNAAVAVAAINRTAVAAARAQALAHPRKERGAFLFGLPDVSVGVEWAAWANGTAVRELDFHDTFLAADYSHPGDNIPALLAVGQALNCTGKNLLEGIVTAYETQVNLVKSICLHRYKKDHIAHLGPSVAAGLGALLNLPVDVVYQAIGQALHVTCATRQSRKGAISSWKAYAPAFAGKMGIEAVDRAMRGEGSPAPIYEGEDGFMAWMLGGPKEKFEVFLPGSGEKKRAIMETYTKEHSAEYQSQALIDLAFKLRKRIFKLEDIEKIILHTSHHTHFVIGTGSGDPQKMDFQASRETLDHSIMYIFAVALEDGRWHHIDSYTKERAGRETTIALWHKISTQEDAQWTKRYHATNPNEKAFGARVEVRMKNSESIDDEIAMANAHPLGASPFERKNYIEKFHTLAAGIVSKKERERFLQAAENLSSLSRKELRDLNICVDEINLVNDKRDVRGIF